MYNLGVNDMIKSTVLMFDIRNFTDNLFYFSEKKDNSFTQFIKKLIEEGTYLTKHFSNNEEFYINSTGDGFLIIFFGNNHEIRCFLLGLVLTIKFNKLCKDFNKKNNRNISFGIGLESGTVEKIITKGIVNNPYTYLGNVINIAARIESETKSHARANMLIGQEINNSLVKKVFNIDYHSLMNTVKNNPHNVELVNQTIP